MARRRADGGGGDGNAGGGGDCGGGGNSISASRPPTPAPPAPPPALPAALPAAPQTSWEQLLLEQRRAADDDDQTASDVGRFAPSTTGPAHPGTLLAALLAWLDARACGGQFILRLEDLDPARCSPRLAREMQADLRWLGIDWDGDAELQSGRKMAHEAALDLLDRTGALYACSCSRADLKAAGRRAPDGGWAYPNTCRGGRGGRAVEQQQQQEQQASADSDSSSSSPSSGGGGGGWRKWRARGLAVRARLPDGPIEGLRDEGGSDGGGDLSQDPSRAFGDPVVVRRDGAVAYMLAAVVDDALARARAGQPGGWEGGGGVGGWGPVGVTRVVRGRDIAPSTATQEALRRLLGLRAPRAYRHHLLLLEPAAGAAAHAGGPAGKDQDAGPLSSSSKKKEQKQNKKQKLAKLHGSVGAPQLRAAGYTPEEVVGFLAWVCGLRDTDAPCSPRELLDEGFCWSRVRAEDQVVGWDGRRLRWLGGADAAADEEEDEND